MPSLPRFFNRMGRSSSSRSAPPLVLYNDGTYTLDPREAFNESLFAAATFYTRLQFGEPPMVPMQEGAPAQLRGAQRLAAEYATNLLTTPNFVMGNEIFTTVGMQALLQGNGYLYLQNTDQFGIPESIWPVSFWRVKLQIKDGRPQYYIDDKPVPFQNIIHIRNNMDEESLLGNGPLLHLLLELFADQRAFKYIAWLMKNRAMPSYGISPKDRNTSIDSQSMQQEVNKFSDDSTDENTASVIGFDHPLEIHQLGFDPRSIRMADLTKITAERFCAVTRIPPPILYVASNVPADNRSTLGHYRRLAAEDLFKPWWGDFAQQFTRQYWRRFISDPEIILDFDISKVSALQEDDNIVVDRTSKAWNDGVIPINTYLTTIGEKEIPGGDKIYIRTDFGGTPQEQIEEREEERERMRDVTDNPDSDDDNSDDSDSDSDNLSDVNDDDTGTEQESA